MRFFQITGTTLVALGILTSKFTSPAFCFRRFADTRLRGLFVMTAHFHFAEKAFALHLLLQGTERLIDIVIAYDYFNQKNIPPLRIGQN